MYVWYHKFQKEATKTKKKRKILPKNAKKYLQTGGYLLYYA